MQKWAVVLDLFLLIPLAAQPNDSATLPFASTISQYPALATFRRLTSKPSRTKLH